MLKPTNRYKFNKFVSEMPMHKISYAADVSASDVPKITSELNRLTRNTSLTVIITENHTPKSIL